MMRSAAGDSSSSSSGFELAALPFAWSFRNCCWSAMLNRLRSSASCSSVFSVGPERSGWLSLMSLALRSLRVTTMLGGLSIALRLG